MTLTRRSPIRKKRPTRRRRLAGCPRQRCKRAPYRRGACGNLCRPHLITALDAAARTEVMDRAELCTSDRPLHVGGLQWAHGLSRRYLRTRWHALNAFVLCAGCHEYYTRHPDEWAAFLDERLGHLVVEELRRLAFTSAPYDLAGEYARLIGGIA